MSTPRRQASSQAQARKASLPVEIDTDGIGRYPQDTEAAVYFCTIRSQPGEGTILSGELPLPHLVTD